MKSGGKLSSCAFATALSTRGVNKGSCCLPSGSLTTGSRGEGPKTMVPTRKVRVSAARRPHGVRFAARRTRFAQKPKPQNRAHTSASGRPSVVKIASEPCFLPMTRLIGGLLSFRDVTAPITEFITALAVSSAASWSAGATSHSNLPQPG
eukprot:scaffold57434_cov63-Phaeocystis_antarctica.AAC.2